MNMIKNFFKATSFTAALKISGFVKVSFLLGSQMIWFSGVNSVLPLAGAFGGIMGAGLIFSMRQLLHLFFFKTISLSFLSMCIPGLFASLYWSTQSAIIRFFVPLACMGLFVAHPVGGQAFVYSLYWLIPIALYFFPQRSLFAHALGSTFVAHSVGSVIWCYTVPMTAGMWVGLMPIVLVERLLFALGMVATHRILSTIFDAIDALPVEKQITVLVSQQ